MINQRPRLRPKNIYYKSITFLCKKYLYKNRPQTFLGYFMKCLKHVDFLEVIANKICNILTLKSENLIQALSNIIDV